MKNFHHSKVLGPFDIGSGNPSTNQTSTQQQIGSQSSGGITRITGGSQATGRGQAASGSRNRQLNVSGNMGQVLQGSNNAVTTARTNRGNVSVSNTITGISGDDLDSILHNFESGSNQTIQDFASIAHNALDAITPTSQGVATPTTTTNPPSTTSNFLDNFATQLGLTTNELMLLLGVLAFFLSYYLLKRK